MPRLHTNMEILTSCCSAYINPSHGCCAGYIYSLQALKRVWDGCISVELTSLWRLHIVYSKKDPMRLVNLFTQRFASLMVMATLLVGSQVATLFSPSRPTEKARTALEEVNYSTVEFWAGLALCVSIISSILTLLSILIAWSMCSAVGPNNAHVFLRSSVALWSIHLPVRMAHLSIILFFLWVNLFFHVIMPNQVSLPLSLTCALGFFYIITMYSAVGRVLMYSGAIGDERILEEDEGENLGPADLTVAMMEKTLVAKDGGIPVSEQYKIKYQEQLEILEEGGSLHLDELRLSGHRTNHSNHEEDHSNETKEGEHVKKGE